VVRARDVIRPFDILAMAVIGAAGAARLVHTALGAMVVRRVGPLTDCLGHGWAGLSEELWRYDLAGRVASWLLTLAAVTFLVWLWVAVAGARARGRRGVVLPTPWEMTVMWCVPLCNAFMPYGYMRTLAHAWDPGDLEPIRVDRDRPPRGYRSPGVERHAPWRPPRIPLRAWWAAWATTSVLSLALYVLQPSYGARLRSSGLFWLTTLRGVSTAVAAMLCVLVIRGIGALAAERSRRVAASRQR
jgi:Domain of unknown function (DUF4328)